MIYFSPERPWRALAVAAALAVAVPALATLIPRMSFEQVVASSESIVHGTVVRSWAGWDDGRNAIWTHYEVRIADAIKGKTLDKIVISEPGGEVDGASMQIVGAPHYAIGEEIVVFATRTPIGYLRTCGWSQGKFQVLKSSQGTKIVKGGGARATLVDAQATPEGSKAASTSLSSLDGVPLDAFKSRIRNLALSQGSASVGER